MDKEQLGIQEIVSQKPIPKIDIIAKSGAQPDDKGYIREQMAQLKDKYGLNFQGKEAEFAVLNKAMYQAAIAYSHGDSSKLSMLLNESDPFAINKPKMVKQATEFRAAASKPAIAYVQETEVPSFINNLADGGSITHEEAIDGSPVRVRYAQNWELAKKVGANGALSAANVRQGKASMQLLKFRTESWPITYDEMMSNLGGLLIEINTYLPMAINYAKENVYQLAVSSAVPDGTKTQSDNLNRGSAHETHIISGTGKFTIENLIDGVNLFRHLSTEVPTADGYRKPKHIYQPGLTVLSQRDYTDIIKSAPEYFEGQMANQMIIDGAMARLKDQNLGITQNIIVDNDTWNFSTAKKEQHGIYMNVTINGQSGIIKISRGTGIGKDIIFDKSYITGYSEMLMWINPMSIVWYTISGRKS